MQLKMFFIASVLTISTFFNGCCGDCNVGHYQSVGVPFIYKDDNSTLYFDNSNKFYTFTNQKEWIKINDTNISNKIFLSNKWSEIYTKQFVNTTEYISYENDTYVVKNIDTNETILSGEMPTINEIENSTGMDLFDTQISYVPMLSGQLSWDRKTHLASVCIGKSGINCNDVYVFSLTKESNSSWNIKKVVSYEERFAGRQSYTSSLFEKNFTYNFFDINIGMCMYADYSAQSATVEECFIRDGDNIVLKKVFGEIYPKEYKNMIDSMYKDVLSVPRNYTIDEQGNMHLFYNKREDIENGNYNYFWYGYFTKENPTTPLYEQKILWEK